MEIHKLQYRSGLGWVNGKTRKMVKVTGCKHGLANCGDCAIFRCDACDKVVPYSFGCDDDMPNACDDCWVQAHKDDEPMKKPMKKIVRSTAVKKTPKQDPHDVALADQLAREYRTGFHTGHTLQLGLTKQAEAELMAVRNELVVSRQTSAALEANRDQLIAEMNHMIAEMNHMEDRLLKKVARLRMLLNHSIDQE